MKLIKSLLLPNRLIKQTAFPEMSGVPDWGCLWRCCVATAELFYWKRYNMNRLMRVYHKCRTTISPINHLPVLDWDGALWSLNDPGEAVQIALDEEEPDTWKAWQTYVWEEYIQDGWQNGTPRKWLAYSKQWQIPGTSHYTLVVPEIGLAWDPHGEMELTPTPGLRCYWIESRCRGGD